MAIPYFSGIRFHTWGDAPGYTAQPYEKRFNGYYGIQYNHEGALEFGINDDPRAVVEGPYAFISYPGDTFWYGCPGDHSARHHCYVCFSGPRIDEFIAGGLLTPVRTNALVPVILAERFYASFRELLHELDRPGGETEPRVFLLLEDLLLQLQEQPKRKYAISRFCEKEISELRTEILRDPVAEWDFAAEARRLSVSEAHFRRLFREVTGCPVKRFLIEARLNRAANLLTSTALPLSEVARQCGFDDEFYFSRLFRLHRRVTASAYRKEYRLG